MGFPFENSFNYDPTYLIFIALFLIVFHLSPQLYVVV